MKNQMKTRIRMKRIIIFLLVVILATEIGNGNRLYAMEISSETNADIGSDVTNNDAVSFDSDTSDGQQTEDEMSVTPSTYSGYQAISNINEVYRSGKKTRVGGYYYWIKSKNKSFKVYRSKKEKGSGSVIFKHSNKQIHTKVMGKWAVAKYAYTGIYTNGKELIFGEYNRSKKTLTLIKRNIKKKKNKKITTIKSGYFASYSGLGCCTLEAVYQNKCYIRKQREKSQKFDTFVINLKNGKKQKIKTKVNISAGIFDGRYIYMEYGKKVVAFDCKNQKVPTVYTIKGDTEVELRKGEDGIYLIKDDNDKHRTYVVRIYGSQEIDDTIDLAYTGSYFYNYVGKITKQYIYYYTYKRYQKKNVYKRYDRVSGETTTLKKKVYKKEVDS